MRAIQFTFKILTIIGCCQPESWSSCIRIVYDVYTVFIIILLHTFLITQFLDIIWNVDNVEDFFENFHATLTIFLACSKMLNLLLNRNNIDTLTNILVEKPYRPLNIDEMIIWNKFDKLVYINTLCYMILLLSINISFTMTSLLTDFRKRNLTYRAWLPYDYNSSTIVFCLTYAHQIISFTVVAFINVACDSLICGLLVHICCQIKILECRLNKVSNDHNNLHDCIFHHDSIFKYALRLNKKFKMTIAMQFITCVMMICSNLYQITKSSTIDASHLPFLLYTFGMLTEIFIFCWCGNEVKLNSIQVMDNIFEMNWLTLDKNFKESLLIVMNRALVPIEFTSAYVFSMNLDCFVELLKMTYSVYNLIKQV